MRKYTHTHTDIHTHTHTQTHTHTHTHTHTNTHTHTLTHTHTHSHTCSTDMNFLEPLAELKLLVSPLRMAVCTTCSGRVEEEESLFICYGGEKWW
jgi:carbohydrate-binding DOMON domain-containing protein